MSIIRKYKISKLTGIPLEKRESEAISFMKNILNDLTIFEYDKRVDSIYYMNSKGQWIFEQDNKNDIFRVRHSIVWEVLVSKYSMERSEIEELIKYMVENVLKQKVSIHIFFSVFSNILLEDAYKKLNK